MKKHLRYPNEPGLLGMTINILNTICEAKCRCYYNLGVEDSTSMSNEFGERIKCENVSLHTRNGNTLKYQKRADYNTFSYLHTFKISCFVS